MARWASLSALRWVVGSGTSFIVDGPSATICRHKLAHALAEGGTLEELLRGSERELRDLRTAFNSKESGFRDALRDALELEVFFHTGVATLDEATEDRLARLGGVMQVIEDFAVVIEGHADARGDAQYNEQLSAQRAAAVRDALVKAGLSPDKITASAVGEQFSTAEENDLDALALERRVSLSVVDPKTGHRVASQ